MKWKIDSNVIYGVLRSLVPAVVAYLVGRGYISQSSAADIGAAALTLLSAVWSVKSNLPSSTTPVT